MSTKDLLAEDLGERVRWSADTVSDLESGRRRIGIKDMPKLCRAFNVPLEQLLHGAKPAALERRGALARGTGRCGPL